MSLKQPRAIIAGGSLGGFFAANMLRQVCGWAPTSKSASSTISPLAAGGATPDEMFKRGMVDAPRSRRALHGAS
jgi:hypothetical protein